MVVKTIKWRGYLGGRVVYLNDNNNGINGNRNLNNNGRSVGIASYIAGTLIFYGSFSR